MDPNETIATIAGWLNVIDTTSAPARAQEMRDEYTAKSHIVGGALGVPGAKPRARHEAAHSVVAHRGGFTVKRAVVRADASGGHVAYDSPDADQPETLLAMAITALAGPVSELLYGGTDAERHFVLAHSADILSAAVSIEDCRACAPAWDITSATVVRLAVCAVAANRPEIERVADALLLRGELTGADVSALCGRPQ
jgi:hypothetical protein